MGGTTFSTSAKGALINDAFRRARDEAQFESGHGGYTGTLAEKHDYVVIQHQPLPRKAAEALATQLIDQDDDRIRDKWGPAGAIPFLDTTATTRDVTLRFSIPGGLDWDGKEKAIREEIAKKVKLRTNERVIAHAVLEDTPAPAKVKAVASKGKSVTRYTVTGTTRQSWETGCATQAEARAYAVEQAGLNDRFGGDVKNYDVIPVTKRESGEPLVRVTRTIPKHDLVVKVEVMLESPTLSKISPDGWIFFGWASC